VAVLDNYIQEYKMPFKANIMILRTRRKLKEYLVGLAESL
jgi:hypothetical protein